MTELNKKAAITDFLGFDIPNFEIKAQLGQIPGVSYIRKYGENLTTSTISRDVVSFLGAGLFYEGFTNANETIFLASNNAGDTSQSIIVFGIELVGGNWIEKIETFALTGLTPVPIGSWLRINRMRLVKGVSSPVTPLLGQITATTNATGISVTSDETRARMEFVNGANQNTTKMAVFTVPKGKVALLERIFGASLDNKIGSFSLEVRERNGDWISSGDFSLLQSPIQLYTNFERIPEETDIRIRSKVDVGTGETDGSLHMYLVDIEKTQTVT